MKIQIFSDLHLEFGELPAPYSNADVVIAAGDIHIQDQAVEWLQSINKPVIYICGNHELWKGDYTATIDQLREQCANSHVHFLERDSVTINDVIFHGCTLWTNYADRNKLIMEDVAERINDFKYIQNGENNLTPDDILNNHEKSLNWLQQVLEQHQSQRQVVVTHHAPTQQSWSRHPADILQFAYCNQFDEWLRTSCPAELWVHGHIHHPSDYQRGNTRIVCNPRGYHGLAEREDFNIHYCIEI